MGRTFIRHSSAIRPLYDKGLISKETAVNPFLSVKADHIEYDEFNTWEKFYSEDKESVKPEWPKIRVVQE